ncbi:hypothetical protein H632_c4498p0 [Helicosporidium sp. ATCC 50920]|nr:hypothetical protein H632_c4498p0 [Helicosporidium sp. ATCC 50920]|eukprot:KDD71727.1 hypothetical protein H632_c4498p0 [Helicosporidium sp. ATCC 50920]
MLGRRLGAGGGLTLAGGALVALLTVVYSAFRAGSADLTWGEETSGSRESGMALLGDDEGAGDGHASGAPRPLRAMSRAEAAEPGSYGAASAAPRAPIPYSYAQFYAVLALASAYVSMLMTGWGAGMMAPGLVDVGWTSVYVKCATQWGAGVLYLWMLFAPALFPDRDFY